MKGSPPRFTQLGFGIQPDGQDFHMVREVLVRQFGGTPYSDGGKNVNYDSPAGLKAMTFYTELFTKHKLGTPNFFPATTATATRLLPGRSA
ncbi:hypothetical protein ACFSC4_20260 [Deinococcus malanensis]|uniref:hypothetical protein n=1 Tax=Deinococcus malanensis TaxID=1706855 RepID=UPI0036412BD0